MKIKKRAFAQILSAILIFNSFAIARPTISIGDDIDPNDPPIIIRPREGQPYCQSGCGPNHDPRGRGDGRGTGNGEGRGTGGDGASGSIPQVGSGGRRSDGGSPLERGANSEGPFRGWDRSNNELSEAQAWRSYQEQVKKLNEKWTSELEPHYQAEQNQLEVSNQIISAVVAGKLPESRSSSAVTKNIDSVIAESMPQDLQGYQYLVFQKRDLRDLLDYQFQSDYRAELNEIRSNHANFKPQSPQALYAYREGLKALISADQSYINKDDQIGSFYKEAGKLLLDIATDVIPMTSMAKDLYRLFVGKDPFSGLEISKSERVMAGGFFILTIASLGTIGFVKLFKEAKVIAKATSEQAKIAESFFESAKILELVRWATWSDLGKVIVDGREYAQIGERLYTKHAIDRMVPKAFGYAFDGVAGRGVPTIVVEATIATGEKIASQVLSKGRIRETWKMGNVHVITENNGRLVVSVMRVGG